MAREIDMDELQTIVMEEVEKVESELKGVKAKEVKACDYADTVEEPIDWEKKLSLKPKTSNTKAMLENLKEKETRAMQMVKVLRKQRQKIYEEYKKEQLRLENKRLKEAIIKFKKSV